MNTTQLKINRHASYLITYYALYTMAAYSSRPAVCVPVCQDDNDQSK